MEQFNYTPSIRLIQTSLKLVVATQKLMLAELEKQTQLAQQAINNAALHQAEPAGNGKRMLMVLNATEVASLLGLHRNYGYKKVKNIKNKLHLPADGPLKVQDFCRATGFTYQDVCKGLGRK